MARQLRVEYSGVIYHITTPLRSGRMGRNACSRRTGIGQKYLKERRRDATWRAVASWMLCKYGGRTQRQVAAILGAKTGVAISCQLNTLRRKLDDDAKLCSQVARIEKTLQKS